jgi:Sulfatase
LWIAAIVAVVAGGATPLIGTAVGPTEAAPSGRNDTTAAAAARPPVVMIVFDAFPTISLLNANKRIDGVRYPTFARLAADSIWYPNATTSLDETGRAFRSIFTSRTSWRWSKPNHANHPKNLFTMLGRRYRIEASEEATSFCPKRLCPNVRPQTRRSIEDLMAAGRAERFVSWLEGFAPSRRPTFYFKHALLPHAPLMYLPSGRTYYDGPSEQNAWSWDGWHAIPWLIQQKYQRHLLQLEFTDRLVGRVLDQLQAQGLYDRSLIIVTADHGETFGRPGNGREIDRRTAAEVGLKPLFVKLPFQRSGRIDRRYVRNVDILPTIARVARLRPNWPIEGHPMVGPEARRIPRSILFIKRSGQRIRVSPKWLSRRAAASLRLKLKLFGAGTAGGLFGIGPHPELHGTEVTRWPPLLGSALRVYLDNPERFRDVRLDAPTAPVKVSGRLSGPGSEAPHDLAVAVNGTIAATAPALAADGGSGHMLSVMIPESSLREGANAVQVFTIEGDRGAPALRPIGGS